MPCLSVNLAQLVNIFRRTGAQAAQRTDGERRTRTADTSIFSRVLYQLSYLAATLDPSVSGPVDGHCELIGGHCLVGQMAGSSRPGLLILEGADGLTVRIM